MQHKSNQQFPNNQSDFDPRQIMGHFFKLDAVTDTIELGDPYLLTVKRMVTKLQSIDNSRLSDSAKSDRYYSLIDQIIDSAETYGELKRIERFIDLAIEQLPEEN